MQNNLYDKPKLMGDIDFDSKRNEFLLVDNRVKTVTILEFSKEQL